MEVADANSRAIWPRWALDHMNIHDMQTLRGAEGLSMSLGGRVHFVPLTSIRGHVLSFLGPISSEIPFSDPMVVVLCVP